MALFREARIRASRPLGTATQPREADGGGHLIAALWRLRVTGKVESIQA